MYALDKLINRITPFMVASSFAQPGSIRNVDKSVHCTFAAPGGVKEYRILGNGFIDTSTQLPHNIIEIVSQVVGGTLEDGAREILHRFTDDLRDLQNELSVVILAEATMRWIAARDSLLGTPIKTDKGNLSDILHFWMSLPSIAGLNLGVNEKGKNCLDVALFANTCTLASRYRYVIGEQKGYLDPQKVPYKHAYTNFHTFSPESILFIHSTPEVAARAMLNSTDPLEAHTYYAHTPFGEQDCWLPRACYYVSAGEPDKIVQIAPLVQAGVIVRITRATNREDVGILGSMSWEGAAADAIVDLLDEAGRVTDLAEVLLSTVRTNRTAQRNIISALENMKHHQLAHEIASMYRTGVVWSKDDQCIYTTTSGYVHEDKRTKALGGTQLSNFTVTPQQAIRYETGDMFYTCKIDLKDNTYYIPLPGRVFETITKLVDYIQTYISLSGMQAVVTPSVFDALLLRPVLGYWQQQFSELTPVRGVSFLGWDGSRARFNGPNFTSSDRVEVELLHLKPTIDHLQKFSAATLPTQRDASNLPKEGLNLIRACAGIIGRTYSNAEITPVTYKNTPGTRATLARIFYLAGQDSIIHLNPNMRHGTELSCFQGYPVLTTGYNCNQAKACKTGIILLGEEGNEFELPDDSVVAEEVAACLRYVIEQLPAWIIKNNGLRCVLSSADVTSDQIINDGATILEDFYKD